MKRKFAMLALPSKIRRQAAWWNILQFYVLCLFCILVRCTNEIIASWSAPRSGIIIAEPFGMGDVIALEPLVANLRQAGELVTVLAQERWRSIFSDIAWISVPKPWPELGIFGFIQFASKLSRSEMSGYRGTIGIDPRGDIRSILLLLLLGCKDVITLDYYEGLELKIPYGIGKRAVRASSNTMRWERNLQFLHAFEIESQSKRPPRVEHLRGCVTAVSRQIGIIPVAPWAGKKWMPERWTAVISQLRDKDFDPIVICGPGQESAALAAVGLEDVKVLKATNLPELARNIASCKFIITVDSGPMHLTSALDVPLVALYGTGQLPMWAPFSTNSKIVTSPGFWENSAHFVNVHPVECHAAIGQRAMSKISSERVIRAFFELYEEIEMPAFRQEVVH